jgi:multiple antibiotic resistance protein
MRAATMDVLPFIQSFVLLLVIMDPLVSMAVFLSMTRDMKNSERSAVATKAVLVAAVPLFLFVLGGNVLLELMKVDINTFKAAGGVVLMLLGVQLSLGISLPKSKEENPHDLSAVASVIGTPLITGPATISAAVILTNEFGGVVTAVSGFAALAVVWMSLMVSMVLHKRLGNTGVRVLSTMMGLITIAWGVSFLKAGFLGTA